MGSADLDQWTVDCARSADAFSALLGKGWRIEVAAESGGPFLPVQNPSWNLVGSGIDWFDLQGVIWGELAEGASADVTALLRCLRDKSSFIQVPGKGAFLINGELRRFLEAAREVGRLDGEKLQIAPGLAGVMLAMGGTGVPATADPESGAARLRAQAAANLKDFDGIQPADPQATFAGTLRDYQKMGLGWLRFLRQAGLGGCLADDMGLGKTVQVIAMLDEHHAASNGLRPPSLVVAPLSLLENWFEELRKFAPRLRVHIHHGSERFSSARHLNGYDIILTTYGLVHSDGAWLSKISFEYVVLDEAHQIRNPEAKTTAAVKRLACRHRLALTGTPIINYVRDLKSLFDFLSPGLLHAIPDLNKLMKNGGPLNDAEARKIGHLLRPFILRRTKGEVLKDLPAKTESMLYCELTPEERETYDGLRDACRRQLLQDIGVYGIDQQRMHVLAALMRLRQLACHPGMLDPYRQTQAGGKLNLLLDELEQVLEEGHKVLVFSNFVSFLQLIRSRLQADGRDGQILYLDGSTPDRGELVRQFQDDPAKRIFLISIKAGGLGLNLTAADYVYIVDPWWNSAIETQAIDRTHRIGQEKPRLRLPPHRPRHHRRENAPVAGDETRPGGPDSRRKERQSLQPDPGRRGVSVFMSRSPTFRLHRLR
jgi:superfamily II DNA or RNA helicase